MVVPRKDDSPAGATVSNRQLAYTVRDGRRVTFHIPNLDPVLGYLAGMDDYHWLVVTPDLKLHLVHKGFSRVDLGTLDQKGDLESEANKDEIQKLIRPFLQYLQKRHLIPEIPGGE